MSHIPVLYFSFANQADQHLSNLEEELDEIEKKLRNKEARQKIILKKESKTTIQKILDLLPLYRDNLLLFHYAGHASGERLDFVDQAADANRLAAFFRDYPKLKLVFLNGCSTRGQVKSLIDAGVDAVIATSVKISDRRAKDFAIHFYHAFAEAGDNLQVAYNHAVQSILMPGENQKQPEQIDQLEVIKVVVPVADGEDKEYEVIENPVEVRGQGMPVFTGTLPWGLYYQNASILQWKLEDDFPRDEQIDLREEQLKATQKDYDEIKQVLEVLDQRAADLSVALLALPVDQQADSELTQELEMVNLDRAIEEAKLVDLEKKLSELSGLEGQLRTSISKINFKDQINFFSNWKNRHKIGAFLIQGPPKCGQVFLAQELVPKNILNFSKDRYRLVPVFFSDLNHNNSYEKEAIWKNVRMSLQIPPVRNQLEQKVVESIQKILQKQHLVLMFDGVNHLAANAVSQFWSELQELLRPGTLDIQSVYPNRLILILLDRDAELAEDAATHHWQAVSFPRFKEVFDGILPPLLMPDILAPILPLELADLTGWLIESKLPEECPQLKGSEIQKILKDSEGYILPTIRMICEKIGHPQLYENYYEQFDFE